MLKNYKKYFITFLALVLIFSNFSFATTLMLCGMSDENISCSCNHPGDQGNQDVVFKKVKSSCCETETVELINSNILQIVKNDLTGNFLVILNILNVDNSERTNSQSVHLFTSSFNYHLPNSDIPIANSSLLI